LRADIDGGRYAPSEYPAVLEAITKSGKEMRKLELKLRSKPLVKALRAASWPAVIGNLVLGRHPKSVDVNAVRALYSAPDLIDILLDLKASIAGMRVSEVYQDAFHIENCQALVEETNELLAAARELSVADADTPAARALARIRLPLLAARVRYALDTRPVPAPRTPEQKEALAPLVAIMQTQHKDVATRKEFEAARSALRLLFAGTITNHGLQYDKLEEVAGISGFFFQFAPDVEFDDETRELANEILCQGLLTGQCFAHERIMELLAEKPVEPSLVYVYARSGQSARERVPVGW
jgi:hypothetical protein